MEMEMEMERPSVHADGDDARRRLGDYLLALEEERSKIQVFQRELPLCLDLVTQTIERLRSHLMGGGASEETVSDHGPVLEEFIPLKPSPSPSSSDDETTHAVSPVAERDEPPTRPPTPRPTPDWLQSVQLWGQQSSLNKEMPCKPVALNATKAGGAFHPFEKTKRAEPDVPPASSTTAPASSAVVGDSSDKATSFTEVQDDKDIKDIEKDKDKEGQSQPNRRKPRRCWQHELHRQFVKALHQLGGPHVATPKQIRELMQVDGLTNDEVKSHLQKYRLHTSRRPTSTAQSTSGAAAIQSTPQQFVVMGSCIWVTQQEYAAAAAAAAQPHMKPTNAAPGTPSQVYAPVATLPSGLPPHSEKQTEDRRSSGSTGNDDSSGSPSVSSSSQTTSA